MSRQTDRGNRLGIDLGGTSAKIAVVEPTGTIVAEARVETAQTRDPRVLSQNIGSAAKALLRGRRCRAVGVGVAGDIDSARGVVRISPNLGWKNVPLGPLLKKQLRLPVTVDNDANAAAWGIYRAQTAPSVGDMIVLTLGTGVGGGIILGGRLHRGATGSAGEIGHMTVVPGGRRCNCGGRGCLETYAGGFHISAHAKRLLKSGRRSALHRLMRGGEEITPRAIARAANDGDAFARAVWEEAGRMLGLAIGDLVYVLNPQEVVLTGGVAQAGDLLLRPLRKALAQRTFKTPVGAVRVRVAARAAQMGVVGAALL